jgi:signal peptidase I
MPDSGERFMDVLGASDDAAEQPHSEWRRRLHRFCENWIFALIIAFGIRHFGVELFRIPSASMEPVLLGDPGFGKGDFVLVDKLTSRFRSVHRWDVAVFQYPVPEIESDKGGRARPAESAEGDRLDAPLTRPLLGSNFVKRAVILPGEEFYIQGGEVFLRDGSGWTIARKPPALQECLWQTIYRVDGQPGYRPWSAEAGSSCDVVGNHLELHLAGAAVHFTQPLRNVYLKDGAVAARPLGSQEAWTRIEDVGMTHPRFAWSGGIEGSIWELHRWELKRLTSADNDDPNRGTQINALMTEWSGDLRVGCRIEQITGSATLSLVAQAPGAAAAERSIDLHLSADGWTLTGGGVASGLQAAGSTSLAGKQIDLAYIDGDVVVRVDGHEAHRSAVTWVDPNLHRPNVAWTGSGTLTVADLIIQRDLHYTTKGFLAPAINAANPDRILAQLPSDPEDRDNAYAGAVRMPRRVRAQLLGRSPDDLDPVAASRAYGTGPDNPARAPAASYLMLGDNSPHSLDGRDWGFVPAENMRGRGWLVVFPPQRWKVIR